MFQLRTSLERAQAGLLYADRHQEEEDKDDVEKQYVDNEGNNVDEDEKEDDDQPILQVQL